MSITYVVVFGAGLALGVFVALRYANRDDGGLQPGESSPPGGTGDLESTSSVTGTDPRSERASDIDYLGTSSEDDSVEASEDDDVPEEGETGSSQEPSEEVGAAESDESTEQTASGETKSVRGETDSEPSNVEGEEADSEVSDAESDDTGSESSGAESEEADSEASERERGETDSGDESAVETYGASMVVAGTSGDSDSEPEERTDRKSEIESLRSGARAKASSDEGGTEGGTKGGTRGEESTEFDESEESAESEEAEEPTDREDDEAKSTTGHWLEGMSGPVEEKTFQVDSGRTTLGRHERNDIRVAEGSVSRVHCRFRAERGDVLVESVDTPNGTRLNGEELEPGEPETLEDGDVLEVGQLLFRYHREGSFAEDHREETGGGVLGSTARTVQFDELGLRERVAETLEETGGDVDEAAEMLELDVEVIRRLAPDDD